MNQSDSHTFDRSNKSGIVSNVSGAETDKLVSSRNASRMLGQGALAIEGSWTPVLIASIIAATLGSFQFGYHIGCINVPADVIIDWYAVSHEALFGEKLSHDEIARFQWAITIGIFAIGGMIGGLSSGWFADRMGRKNAMLFNNIFATIAAVLMTAAKYVNAYPLMIVGRLVIGINSGINSGLVPLYLTEISPINLRGAVGSVHQLFLTIAILFSQIIGLPSLLGSVERWPFLFGFTIVPVIVQLIILPMCPESPKYNLIIKNRSNQAERDLRRLRAKNDVRAEMEAMNDEASVSASSEKVGILNIFHGEYLWPITIAIMMMLGQQFSGINVAMFFSTKIFANAGLAEGALYATLGMGAVNVAMTILSVYLVDHPKCGRRLLLLTGFVGMMITSILLVFSITLYNLDNSAYGFVSYFSVVLVYLFVVSFATGPGSIPWFFVSELFNSAARSSASSVAVMANWTANFIVGTSFEYMHQFLHQYVFLVFSACLAFFIFFVWMYVPETKGRTIEDVNAELARGKSRFARRRRV